MEGQKSKTFENLLSLIPLHLKENFNNLILIEHGPLEINGFSITFWANFQSDLGKISLYVKIPKIIWGNKKIGFDYPVTEEDRVLARNEFRSLKNLSVTWNSDPRVSFIRPLGYIKEFNAIITERVYGDFFFKKYRSQDFKRRLKNKICTETKDDLYRFGKSLQHFHQREIRNSIFKSKKALKKHYQYLEALKNYDVNLTKIDIISGYLKDYINTSHPSLEVNNLKGIDIRQILIETEDAMRILDPGKISRSYVEVDLARFIVTCRILYWGTLWILFKFRPDKKYEQSFINGYANVGKFSNEVLNIMIIKEILKHWQMAHISLHKRSWPSFFKYALKKIYIDRFYMTLFNDQVNSNYTEYPSK
tara:strand:- start:9713 stop:10801 length:1089 start_codon:yes stop_codon:yes gene_type:complete